LNRTEKPKLFYGYIVVLAASFILVVSWGILYSFGVFLEPIITEFGWTRAATSGAYSLLVLLQGLLSIVAGRLNDKLGPRIALTGSGFFFGFGILLMSQISAIWHLYLLYGVVIAIGVSSAFVPLTSTVARWFVKMRGLMTGIVVAGIGIGTMIIPPLVNLLISTYGWRTSYIILGIIALVVIVSAAQFLRREPSQIGLSPYGEDEVKQKSLNLQARGLSFQEAVHTKQLWLLCAIYFCFYFCTSTILVHIVIHATGLGISAASATVILATLGGVSIAGKVAMGGIADKIGNKLTLIICFILMATALIWLMAIQEVWMFYLFAAIFGFAYGGLATLMSPVVAELFGLSSHGIILGVVFASDSVGGAIGSVLAGGIFDISGSYQWAFLICVAISAIGIVLTLFLSPMNSGGGTND